MLQLTRISQQTPSNSSSFVKIPDPEARHTPISANNGAESPKRNLTKKWDIYLEIVLHFNRKKTEIRYNTNFLVASFRKSAE